MRYKGRIVISACVMVAVLIGSLVMAIFAISPNEETFDFDAFYAQKLAKFEEENALYDDFEVDVAFLGDSLTDMCDLEKYYPQYVTANRGISGDTSIRLETRLKVSVYDLKPKVIVLLIGANNFSTMLSNYERIVTSIQQNLPTTQLVILSLTAMGGNWGRNNGIAKQNNVEIKRIAQAHDCIFVDMYTPLANPQTGEIYEEYTTDGGHQTDAGYRVFQANITPAIEEALARYRDI